MSRLETQLRGFGYRRESGEEKPMHRHTLLSRALVLTSLTLLLCLVAVGSAFAETLYVSQTGTDQPGAGTSGNPYQTIQYAIDHAVSGDTVAIGAGEFWGSVTMTNGVSLTGQGPATTGMRIDNSVPTLIADGISQEATISGLSIRVGSSGLRCVNGSRLHVENCVIRDCMGTSGCGIYCTDSTITVNHTQILDNHGSGEGGNVYCARSSLTMYDSACGWGTCDSAGGGFSLHDSSAKLTSCTVFANNSTWYSGGNFFVYRTDLEFTNGYMNSGGAYNNGGGMWAAESTVTLDGIAIGGGYGGYGGGVVTSGSRMRFNRCTIDSNWSWYGGGGLWLTSSPTTITACTFRNNHNDGGGPGAALGLMSSPSAVVENSVFYNNATGGWGGAVAVGSSPTTITNCTFYRNTGSAGAGAIECRGDSTATVTNCIAWGNGDTDLTQCSATYSDIGTDTVGLGNISVYPSFVSTSTWDLRLLAASPCLDVATSTGAPASDRNGISRPQGSGYDMGAYEMTVAPPPVPEPTSQSTSVRLSGPSKVKLKKAYKLTGAISPSSARGAVTITWKRYSKGAYRKVKAVVVRIGSGGKFTYAYKPQTRGKWRAYVSYDGQATSTIVYLPAKAAYKGFTVK